MKLSGKIAIITGANRGFGYEVARAFLEEGASIAICARDQQQLTEAKNQLKQYSKNNAQIFAQALDITNYREVDQFVQKIINTFGKIDILVANAGVYGTKGPIEEINWDEWSDAIDINLKGTVYLCRALLPSMKQNKYGKIIILSGGGATKPMPFLSAYAASKAAVVRFAETLAEEVKSFHIDVNSVAPGALNTRLLDEILTAGPEKVGDHFYQQAVKQKETGGTPLEKGVALCNFLAAPESDGITGKLISAVWDPWHSLTKLKDELAASDIYTLRRITPGDRGKDWDKSL